MGGETFQEKDIFGISKGKYSNFCFCSGKAPLRNKNSALKNGGGFSLRVGNISSGGSRAPLLSTLTQYDGG
jgi:hypothetical protein